MVVAGAGAEERRLYTTLPRPLPDYALAHVFAQYGPVDFVRLQSDARHGVVQFTSAESAAAALAGLAGTDICGQVRAPTVAPPRPFLRLHSGAVPRSARSLSRTLLAPFYACGFKGWRWLLGAGSDAERHGPAAAGAKLKATASGALRAAQDNLCTFDLGVTRT